MNQTNQQFKTTYVTRTHKIQIHRNHPYYKLLDELAFKSKNLYNLALYESRKVYFETNKFPNQFALDTILKDTDAYKELKTFHSHLPQNTLKLVAQNTKAFINATKQYYKTPERFNGKPKLPKYKPKTTGRFQLAFSYQEFNIKNNQIHINSCGIHIPIPSHLKGLQKPIKLTDLTSPEPKLALQQIRIIPLKTKQYTIELVYTKQLEVPINQAPITKVASIDLGINNLVTLVTTIPNEQPLIINGKPLKSYNKQFNKTLAHLKSQAMKCNNRHTTNQINILYQKRNNYFNTKMHQIASYLTNYLVKNQIQLLIVGYNPDWKQASKLSKQVNQTFIQIPYLKLIQILQYKCEEHGIHFKLQEESYTSGTSFLDNEQPSQPFYNKTRRKYRGLFQTNQGNLINADVNASYQIIVKAFPAYQYSSNLSLIYQNPRRVTVA